MSKDDLLPQVVFVFFHRILHIIKHNHNDSKAQSRGNSVVLNQTVVATNVNMQPLRSSLMKNEDVLDENQTKHDSISSTTDTGENFRKKS